MNGVIWRCISPGTATGTVGTWVSINGAITTAPAPSGDTTGVTDSANLIAAGANGGFLILQPGTYWADLVTLVSNTVVWIPPTTMVKLPNGASSVANGQRIFINQNWQNVNSLDNNIEITGGGTIDGNAANNPDSGYHHSGLSFLYCDNVRVHGLTIQNVLGIYEVYQAGTIANSDAQSAASRGLSCHHNELLNFQAGGGTGTYAVVYSTSVQTRHSDISENLFYNHTGSQTWAITIEDGSTFGTVCKNLIDTTQTVSGGILATSGTGVCQQMEFGDNVINLPNGSDGIVWGGTNTAGMGSVHDNTVTIGSASGASAIAIGTGGNSSTVEQWITVHDNYCAGASSGNGISVVSTGSHILIHDNITTGNAVGIYLGSNSSNCLVHDNDVATNTTPIQNLGTNNLLHHNPGAPSTAPTSFITSNINLSAGTGANVTSITLPPGTWVISAQVLFQNTSTSASSAVAWISTTSAGGTHLSTGETMMPVGSVTTQVDSVPCPEVIVNPTTATTYYLNAQMSGNQTAGVLASDSVFSQGNVTGMTARLA